MSSSHEIAHRVKMMMYKMATMNRRAHADCLDCRHAEAHKHGNDLMSSISSSSPRSLVLNDLCQQRNSSA